MSGDAELPRELEMNGGPTCEDPRRLDWIGVAAPIPTAMLEESKLELAVEGNRTPPFRVQCCNGGVDEVELSPTLKST